MNNDLQEMTGCSFLIFAVCIGISLLMFTCHYTSS